MLLTLKVLKLCTDDDWLAGKVFNLNVLGRILALVAHSHQGIRQHAIQVLTHLTRRADVREEAVGRGGVKILVDSLKASDDDMKKVLLRVLNNLSKHRGAVSELCRLGFLHLINKYFNSSDKEIQRQSSDCLSAVVGSKNSISDQF